MGKKVPTQILEWVVGQICKLVLPDVDGVLVYDLDEQNVEVFKHFFHHTDKNNTLMSLHFWNHTHVLGRHQNLKEKNKVTIIF